MKIILSPAKKMIVDTDNLAPVELPDVYKRQINDMRDALRESLEKQWKTEQEKNRQMSALAHDIKTVSYTHLLFREVESYNEKNGYEA